jgi:hypothetical protein
MTVAPTLSHAGYVAELTIDEVIHGRYEGRRCILTFECPIGATEDELRAAFAETLADYKDWRAAREAALDELARLGQEWDAS